MWYNATKGCCGLCKRARRALPILTKGDCPSMEKSKIDRINALAKKAKSIGLTERETAERDALRKEYLADMRASFKQQLDATYVQTADGAKIPYAEYAKLNRK